MTWRKIPSNPNWHWSDETVDGKLQELWDNMQVVDGIRTDGENQIFARTRRTGDSDNADRGEINATYWNARSGVFGIQDASYYSALPVVGLNPILALMLSSGSIYPTTTETVTTSFTRATPSSVTTVDGREGVQIGSGEVPFHGFDRIENLLPFPEDLENAGWGNTNVTVTSGVSDPDGGSTAFTLTADAGNAQLTEVVSVPTSNSAINSVWVKRRTGTGTINLIRPDNAKTAIDVTSEWQRFATDVTAPQSNVTFRMGFEIVTSGDEIDVWHYQAEVLDGKPNKAPGEYTSRGVGVQPDILTSAITASDWTAAGTNTYTDNGDGSVKITYVDNAIGGYLMFNSLGYPQPQSDTVSTWVLEYRAKVNTGSVDIVMFNETPTHSATVTNTSFETFKVVFSYDGSGDIQLVPFTMGAGEEVDIEVLSIRKADHGANVDGVRYSPYHNPRYVDSNNVVQNDSATGELISSSNNRFANFPGIAGSNYSIADPLSITQSFVAVAYVAAADYSAADTQYIVGQDTAGSRVFAAGLANTGSPRMEVYDSTGSALAVRTADSAGNYADGEGVWIKWEFEWAGSGNVTARFYESFDPHTTHPDDVSSWTQIGTDKTSAATGNNLGSSSQPLFVGQRQYSGSEKPFKGRVYKSAVYATTTVSSENRQALFDANDTTGWTENGNAYITTPPDPAVRISEARTNAVVYSGDPSNAAWNKARMATPVTQGRGPAGDWWLIQDDSSTGRNDVRMLQNFAVSTATTYTYWGIFKADQLFWLALRTSGFTSPGDVYTYFNLATAAPGTVGTGHTAHVERLADGAVLCGITFTTDAADTAGTIQVFLADGDGDATVDLDGTSSILYAVSQFEQGSYPTGYIKTDASAVARNADQLVYTFSEGQTYPLTVVVSNTYDDDAGGNQFLFAFDDGTSTDSVRAYRNGAILTGFVTTSAGDDGLLALATGTTQGSDVLALAVEEDNMDLGVNGTAGGSPDTSVDVLGDPLTRFTVGAEGGGSSGHFNGDIHVIKILTIANAAETIE